MQRKMLFYSNYSIIDLFYEVEMLTSFHIAIFICL